MSISNFDIGLCLENQYNKISRSDKIAYLLAIFVGLCAHGAALVSFFINEDFQISGYQDLFISGRFLMGPIYDVIESHPFQFLQVFIFILLAAASGVIISNCLSAKSISSKAAIAGITVSYPAFSIALTYTFNILAYAVAFTCAVLSVHFINKKFTKKILGWLYFLLATVLLTCSLGIYQAYLAIVTSLCPSILVVYLLKYPISSKENALIFLKKAGRFLGFGVASGILYILVLKFYSMFLGKSLSGYQGADKIGTIDVSSTAFTKVWMAYMSFFRNAYFSMPSYVYTTITVLALLAVIVILCQSEIHKNFKNRIANLFIIAFFLFAIILLAIIIPFIAPYAEISFMQTYGFIIILAFCVAVVTNFSNITKSMTVLLSFLIILGFTNNCNINYYKSQLTTQASLLSVNRIFSRIEKVKGFSTNSKLAIIGNLPNQILKSKNISPFTALSPGYSGNFVSLSRVGQSSKFTKMLAVLGYDIKPIDSDEDYLRANRLALKMPIYPKSGSILIDNDIVVIKLNEPTMPIKYKSFGDRKYSFKFTPLTDGKNLEYAWEVVSVTARKRFNLNTPTSQLNFQFETAGETCYVIGAYREKGTKKSMSTKPLWFIVN